MVIFPSVNVPVLSLQITEAEPSVSTAAIFRTSTSCCTWASLVPHGPVATPPLTGLDTQSGSTGETSMPQAYEEASYTSLKTQSFQARHARSPCRCIRSTRRSLHKEEFLQGWPQQPKSPTPKSCRAKQGCLALWDPYGPRCSMRHLTIASTIQCLAETRSDRKQRSFFFAGLIGSRTHMGIHHTVCKQAVYRWCCCIQ